MLQQSLNIRSKHDVVVGAVAVHDANRSNSPSGTKMVIEENEAAVVVVVVVEIL